VITDSSGAVNEQFDYKPFGEEWIGTSIMEQRRFSGQERDPETGLDYFGARFYRRSAGRFTSPDDPRHANIFNPQSLNLYAYALNNPFRFVDPTGHAPCPTNIDTNTSTCVEGRATDLVLTQTLWYLERLFERWWEETPLNPDYEPPLILGEGIGFGSVGRKLIGLNLSRGTVHGGDQLAGLAQRHHRHRLHKGGPHVNGTPRNSERQEVALSVVHDRC
jgi:RHS repeat-associated protein